jgi:hypothetical protein
LVQGRFGDAMIEHIGMAAHADLLMRDLIRLAVSSRNDEIDGRQFRRAGSIALWARVSAIILLHSRIGPHADNPVRIELLMGDCYAMLKFFGRIKLGNVRCRILGA